MRGSVTVDDDGSVLMECWPVPPENADPARLAMQAVTILGSGSKGWRPDEKTCRRGLPVVSAAGLAVRAAGLAAEMVIYPDHHNFAVLTQIIVTAPARPDLGEVRVADDGVLTWECRFPAGSRPGDIACRIGDVVASVTSGGDRGAPRHAAAGEKVPGKETAR